MYLFNPKPPMNNPSANVTREEAYQVANISYALYKDRELAQTYPETYGLLFETNNIFYLFLYVNKEARMISRDCFISYLGNKYSVPYQFAGREATLQIFDGKLRVIIGGELACEHEIMSGNCRTSRVGEHLKGSWTRS